MKQANEDSMDKQQPVTPEQRLDDIESRLAWQEDLLDTLNKTVALQQQQMLQMEKVCRNLIERLNEVASLLEGKQIVDEKPPHY